MFGICRLCLKTFDNANLNVTPDVLRQIEAILPEINLNIVSDPMICQLCLDLLEKAYKFKTSCLETEKSITKLIGNSSKILNIKDLLGAKKIEQAKQENESNELINSDRISKEIVIKKSKSNCFICTLCDRSFTYHLRFLEHFKKHGNDDLKCNYCDKSFIKTEGVNLGSHIVDHHFHLGIKCTCCSMTFRSQQKLRRHLETHERQFKCDTCGWVFKKKTTLNEHLRTHSGEKRYQCELCFKPFAQHSTLKVHMKSTHSDERPFQCEVCGKSFKLKGNHNQHMLTHSKEPHRFSCSHCGKGYWMRNKLEIHERYHTGERPKICHVCSKSFPSQSSLKRHLGTHGDLKPYSCELCTKSFAQRGYLKVHMKTHGNLNS